MNGALNIPFLKYRWHSKNSLLWLLQFDRFESSTVFDVAACIGCTSCPSEWPWRSGFYLVSSWLFGAFVSLSTWYLPFIYPTTDTHCRVYALWNKNTLILSGLLVYLTTQTAIYVWLNLLPGGTRKILPIWVALFSYQFSALPVPLQNYEFHCEFLQFLNHLL